MSRTVPTSEMMTEPQRASLATRIALKTFLQVLLLAGSALLIFLPSVREQFGRVHEISDYLISMGWAAPLIFVPAVALLVAVGVPRLLLCPIGGMAFGFWRGLLLTQIGTMIGFSATFLFVRWSGRDMIVHKWPRLRRYTEFSRRGGIITVLLIRQLPITGFYINLVLGLLPLSARDFLLGTLIGILPAAVPATLVGSSAVHFLSGQSVLYVLLALAALILVWTFSGRMLRSFFLRGKQDVALQASLSDDAEAIHAGINEL